MASNLIVEDGTGLANANSFETAANIRAYATLRGVVLAADDGAGDVQVDVMAIKAMDFIEHYRAQFLGWRFKSTQALSFPRQGVPLEPDETVYANEWVNGYENILMSGSGFRPVAPLPYELLTAQSELVMQIKAGIDLLPTRVSGSFVKRRKVGPIEREFSEIVGIYTIPPMPKVDALLSVLIRPAGPMRAYRA